MEWSNLSLVILIVGSYPDVALLALADMADVAVGEILSGLPSASQAEYTSEGIKKYFNLAEMAFYDATKVVYDPENE